MIQYVYLFVLTFLLFIPFNITAKDVVFYKNLRVFNFRSVGSIQYIHLNVPANTVAFTWNMFLNKSSSHCSEAKIMILAQYGSFPISGTFDNSTLPSNYVHQRSYFLNSSFSSHPITIKNPLIGQWFLGAVMPTDKNLIIQNLLASSCEYGIHGNITYNQVNTETISTGKQFQLTFNATHTYYRFKITEHTYKFKAFISNYQPLHSNFSIVYSTGSLPNTTTSKHVLHVNSDSASSQELEVASFDPEKWQYMLVTLHQASNAFASFEITITLNECLTGLLRNHTGFIPCFYTTNLKTTTYPDEIQSSTFGFQDHNPESLVIPRKHVTMTTFRIDNFKDIGGFLIFDFYRIPISSRFFDKSLNLDTRICVQRGHPPISTNHNLSCNNDKFLLVLNSTNDKTLLRIPYPEPGVYYIGYQDFSTEVVSEVSTLSTLSTAPTITFSTPSSTSDTITPPLDPLTSYDNATYAVMIKVELTQCEHAKCQNNGRCQQSFKGGFLVSSCRCLAQSKGITCADTSEMIPRGIQLLYTLLLTLSNLAFIPAIIVSFCRWRYMECLVYTLNMVFSTFYHACDMNAWSMYSYCLFKYSTLQYSDFLLSILSFWLTLMALSRVRSGLLLVFSLFGVIVVAILIENDVTGAWNNVVPIAAGLLLVIGTWAIKMFKTKRLYPTKKDFLWLIPGLGLAFLGIIIFSTLENDQNYPYTHSAWHMCVAFSVPFILPRYRSTWKMRVEDNSFHIMSKSNGELTEHPINSVEDL